MHGMVFLGFKVALKEFWKAYLAFIRRKCIMTVCLKLVSHCKSIVTVD